MELGGHIYESVECWITLVVILAFDALHLDASLEHHRILILRIVGKARLRRVQVSHYSDTGMMAPYLAMPLSSVVT